MSKPVRIAVLASGRGSNFEAIIRSISTQSLNAEIVALVSDRAEARALEIARAEGIPALLIPSNKNDEIFETLKPYAPRFLVMAGFMRIVGPKLLHHFRSDKGYTRITNIHPSLLPAFPGLNSYSQAFNYGCKVAGVTVHLADSGVDSGPICAQESFSIEGMTSSSEVEKKGLELEHRLYPKTLNWVLKEEFKVEMNEGRLCVRSS